MLDAMDVHYSSESNEWETPVNFFNKLDYEFNFTLDPCASESNYKCDKYFTISLGVEAVASFLEDSLAIQQLTKDFQASSTTYNNPSYNSEFGMSF